ncbi:MAG: hypothetical protein ACR2O4_10590 [Hyphomicrobiaceae bacterium]
MRVLILSAACVFALAGCAGQPGTDLLSASTTPILSEQPAKQSMAAQVLAAIAIERVTGTAPKAPNTY